MKGLIFTYALTYGGAVASLFNPFVGLLIYICFSTIHPEAMWPWAVPVGNYSRTVAVALLVGWALNGFGSWRFNGARPIVWSLVGFLTLSAVSAALAPNQPVAWRFFETQAKIVLPFVVGMTIVDSSEKVRQIGWVLVLSLGYKALEQNLSYYQHGLALNETDNFVAHQMAAGCGVAFFLGLYSRVWWQQLACYLAAGLMVHTVFFQMSRGAMFGVAMTGLTTFIIMPKKPRHYAMFALAALATLLLAGPSVRKEFSTSFASQEERDYSAQSRVDLWRDMWTAMWNKPAFGNGPDHWPLISHQYGWEEGKEGHGLWTQFGAELGAPAAGLILLFYGLTVWRLWQTYRFRMADGGPLTAAAGGTIASLTGFVLEAQFGSFDGMEFPYYTALMGACALKLAYSSAPEATGTVMLPAMPPAFAGMRLPEPRA